MARLDDARQAIEFETPNFIHANREPSLFLYWNMKEKMDPRLSEILEQSGHGIAKHQRVDVLVAIDTPLSDEIRNDLTKRGLTLRTEAGTVLTGGIALADTPRLARLSHVVMIELSAPLYPEKKEQFDNNFTE